MAKPAFKIIGLRETEKVLKALGPKLAERELMKALRAGGNVIKKEVKARAPVGTEPPNAKFGTLKDNIKTTAIKKTRFAGEVAVHTGKAYWAMFVEFGTVKMPARPFIGPAFDAVKKNAIDKFVKTLGRGVEKTALELAGKFGSLKKSTKRRM